MNNILTKRNIIAAIGVGVALAFVALVVVPYVDARSSNNDPITAFADAVDNVAVHLDVASETTATSTILVDRSDVTNFPHLGSGASGIEVAQIRLDWEASDYNSTTTTKVKLGVIASTSPSGSVTDVYWFDVVTFATQNATGVTNNGRQSKTLSYSPSVMKLGLASGEPASFLTNDSLLSTIEYATTTTLLSPNGYVNPGVGDLVMDVHEQTGTATIAVTVIYRTR